MARALSTNPVHLGVGATAVSEPEFTGMEWYADYGARHAADGREGRLAALVPKPRVNLTRFHGVFAPNSALRQQVIPARRGRQDSEPRTSAQRHAAMTWAQRL